MMVRSTRSFSPDGDYLATVSADHHGIIWHARTHSRARPPRTRLGLALAWRRLAACSSLVLATGSHDARDRVGGRRRAFTRRARQGAAGRVLRGHGGAVLALAFDSRGALLASASCDKSVALWCTQRDERVRVLNHPAEVWTCEFAPACDDRADDGEGTDATPSSAGGSANARDGSVSGSRADSDDDERDDPYARSGAAACARAAARRRLLATGCRDRRVLLWDARSATLLAAPTNIPVGALARLFAPRRSPRRPQAVCDSRAASDARERLALTPRRRAHRRARDGAARAASSKRSHGRTARTG